MQVEYRWRDARDLGWSAFAEGPPETRRCLIAAELNAEMLNVALKSIDEFAARSSRIRS